MSTLHPAPWGSSSLHPGVLESLLAALPGPGMVLCTVAHAGRLSGQPMGQTEPAPGGKCHHEGSNPGPTQEKSRLSDATSYTPAPSPSTLLWRLGVGALGC